jgi:hypothetical protein
MAPNITTVKLHQRARLFRITVLRFSRSTDVSLSSAEIAKIEQYLDRKTPGPHYHSVLQLLVRMALKTMTDEHLEGKFDDPDCKDYVANLYGDTIVEIDGSRKKGWNAQAWPPPLRYKKESLDDWDSWAEALRHFCSW